MSKSGCRDIRRILGLSAEEGNHYSDKALVLSCEYGYREVETWLCVFLPRPGVRTASLPQNSQQTICEIEEEGIE